MGGLKRLFGIYLEVLVADREGFEPSIPVFRYAPLAGVWFQPLTHLSKSKEDEIVSDSSLNPV